MVVKIPHVNEDPETTTVALMSFLFLVNMLTHRMLTSVKQHPLVAVTQ